jgi:hypothetical protein
MRCTLVNEVGYSWWGNARGRSEYAGIYICKEAVSCLAMRVSNYIIHNIYKGNPREDKLNAACGSEW